MRLLPHALLFVFAALSMAQTRMPCPRVVAVPDIGIPISGNMAATDCRAGDYLGPGAEAASFADGYVLSVRRRSNLNFRLNSPQSDLNAQLHWHVLNAGTRVQRCEGGSGASCEGLEPRDYWIVVVGRKQRLGQYTLLTSAREAEPEPCPVRPTALNVQTERTLPASGCRVPAIPLKSLYTELFLLPVSRKGTLKVAVQATTFASYLVLADSSYHPLAAAPGNIESVLEPGKYFLAVNSADGRRGAYPLGIEFVEEPSCITGEIGANAAAEGKLASAACQDHFQTTVLTPGVLKATLGPAPFRSVLSLLDSGGKALAEADSGGEGKRSELRSPKLAPGEYSLLIKSSDGRTGAYRLETAFACEAGKGASGKPLSGVLSQDECVTREYLLTAPSRGTFLVDLVSSAFDAYLVLTDSQGNRVGENDNRTAGTTDARLQATVAAGMYTVTARSNDSRLGQYNLQIRFTPQPVEPPPAPKPVVVCRPQSIGVNATVAHDFSASECRSPDGRRRALYAVAMREAATLTIAADAAGSPVSLELTDSKSARVAAGQGVRPQIERALNAGEYSLAIAAGGPLAGPYTLRTSTRPDGCPLKPIERSGQVFGGLRPTDCRVRDVLYKNADASYAHQYSLTLDRSGTITLDLDSNDFDTCLTLFDSQYNRLAENDDSQGDTNSRLSARLAPGRYVVLVRARGVSSGDYRLRTSFR